MADEGAFCPKRMDLGYRAFRNGFLALPLALLDNASDHKEGNRKREMDHACRAYSDRCRCAALYAAQRRCQAVYMSF